MAESKGQTHDQGDADTTAPEFLYIQYDEMKSHLEEILVAHGFPPAAARTCAEVFATNSLEGVYSHGVNRFPKFIDYVRKGYISPDSEAVMKHSAGSLEQWDGQSGPGPVNAILAADRAMELARTHGLGCVALANTNHWLRGGTYGWRVARAGFAYIAWSNTIANMPAWGAKDPRLGNNPLIVAVPHGRDAIVLDMAMSQYSFGALEIRRQNKQLLPLPGGYDLHGNLTNDPRAIMESWRPLPIGYWKGAGLTLLLDILATILSGGQSTAQITAQKAEMKISQVFVAVDLTKLHNHAGIAMAINSILADYHASIPEKEGMKVRYPGENVASIRNENLTKGIPVLRETWEKVIGE